MNKTILSVSILLGIYFAISLTVPALSEVVSYKDYYEIKGKIVDSKNKPVAYSFVSSAKDSTIVCASALDGTFTLKLPKTTKSPLTLKIASINYTEKLHKINLLSKQKQALTIKLVAKQTPTEVFAGKQKAEAEARESRIKAAKSSIPEGEKVAEGGIFAVEEIVDRASIAAVESDVIPAEPAPAGRMVMPDYGQPAASAGLLTAGELNDFAKWNLWEDIATNTLEEYQKTWQILPQQRYVAQLTNEDNMPLQNAKVSLKDKLGNVVWQTYTDNTGKAELWAQMLTDYLPNFGAPYSIEFNYQNQTKTINAEPFKTQINTTRLNARCSDLTAVDIDFIVDATGSMADEISYLQAELYDVIEKVSINNPHIDLQTSTLFYRDWEDDYLLEKTEFSKDINNTIDFIKKQFAAGGGDLPEAIDIALYESIENRQWRENTLAKIIFLILDAPPHGSEDVIKQLHRQIRLAAMKGIRIVPLVCSGADKSTEYLMRSIALATNGTYVFLTDDSGIGAPHSKPTTDKFEVEKLNHILFRIITEYSQPANCNNDWALFNENLNPMEQYLPKPTPDAPASSEQQNKIADIMNIYPTPSEGNLTVDIYKNASLLYLSDITGKVLQYIEITGQNSFNLQLTNYANGTYFVHVLYDEHWYTWKFLLSM